MTAWTDTSFLLSFQKSTKITELTAKMTDHQLWKNKKGNIANDFWKLEKGWTAYPRMGLHYPAVGVTEEQVNMHGRFLKKPGI